MGKKKKKMNKMYSAASDAGNCFGIAELTPFGHILPCSRSVSMHLSDLVKSYNDPCLLNTIHIVVGSLMLFLNSIYCAPDLILCFYYTMLSYLLPE